MAIMHYLIDIKLQQNEVYFAKHTSIGMKIWKSKSAVEGRQPLKYPRLQTGSLTIQVTINQQTKTEKYQILL